jgi:heme exporter protein A
VRTETVAEVAATGNLETTTATRELALDVRELCRRFGDREALDRVTVQLERGRTLAVFGPNGAGKTTFLRVLATLLLPHGGSVRVLDRELPRDAHGVRGRVGFIGHEALLYRELTGRENLEFYARLYQVEGAQDRIDDLLEQTAMSKRANDPVRDLSRGMVQRLAVCRAVLHSPELLLLDEPTAGLDPEAAQLVDPLIGQTTGCTRVLVSHDVEHGLARSDRVLGLRSGRVLVEGPSAAIDAAQVQALYKGEQR